MAQDQTPSRRRWVDLVWVATLIGGVALMAAIKGEAIGGALAALLR